jgi:prepilin-type N-terminal cleavage/methylation domain-containing protein
VSGAAARATGRGGGGDRGFSVVELLASLALLSLAMAGLAGLLIHNSRINRAEQMKAEMQVTARNCLSMIVEKLRNAGWDPLNAGFVPVVLDPSPTNTANYIQILADLNEDGDTDDLDENLLIRWSNGQVAWRRRVDPSEPFVLLADSISNDADGDGVAETMFVPDSMANPTRITVRLTARSPVADPRTGEHLRYTLTSDVVLRRSL